MAADYDRARQGSGRLARGIPFCLFVVRP